MDPRKSGSLEQECQKRENNHQSLHQRKTREECLQIARHMAFVADLTSTRLKKEAHNVKNPTKHSTEDEKNTIRSLSRHQHCNTCTLSQKFTYNLTKGMQLEGDYFQPIQHNGLKRG